MHPYWRSLNFSRRVDSCSKKIRGHDDTASAYHARVVSHSQLLLSRTPKGAWFYSALKENMSTRLERYCVLTGEFLISVAVLSRILRLTALLPSARRSQQHARLA